MTAPARLTGLRLLGFKSFAERTTVEFGGGISAIVGPNGSGKSNLADALRWTLGEAGRSLRTRRAEDVIFAGSSSRRATSMADVTLLLDNRDRLLPVDFGEVELGRRLFRSGENEYLLNRQRVRLRDLTELLDAGNLADNAFLFIGQGMVDQALALRPEERRPLFEEAAGVRRHERRRRQAETELAEAETNLERLRDVLAELRPQARRLAAQAEQLLARRSAGHDLAEALVVAARGRWQMLSSAAEREQAAVASAHAEADSALAELRAAEDDGQRISKALAERAEDERAQRTRLDQQRGRTVELRLAAGRIRSDQQAAVRDRQRITAERGAIAARDAEARQVLAREQPTVDTAALAGQLDLLDLELDRLRAQASGAHAGAPDSRVAAAELATLQRRQAAVRAQLNELAARVKATDEAVAVAVAARDRAGERAAEARTTLSSAQELDRAAHAAHDAALAEQTRIRHEHAEAEATLAAHRARLGALDDELGRTSNTALSRAVRARGGTLAAEGLEVDPEYRIAVAAALGDGAQAWLVDDATAAAVPRENGTLLLRSAQAAASRLPAAEGQVGLAHGAGGGHLADAIRRDPQGQASRLLARTLWVGGLEEALRIRSQLATGWQVVTLDGQLISDHGVVRFAAGNRFLGLREERDAMQQRMTSAEALAAAAADQLGAANDGRAPLDAAMAKAGARLDDARREAAVADEVERTTQRRADLALREQAWQRTRLAGLQADAADVDRLLDEVPEAPAPEPAAPAQQIAELTQRRAGLAAKLAEQHARQRDGADALRRAEIAIALNEARAADLDVEAESLAGRDAELAGESERLAAELAVADLAERELAAALERLATDASHDRAQSLAAADRAASARERLRASETRSRSAEVGAMEAVLQLDVQREQLLVELAGIGQEALAALAGEPDVPALPQGDEALGDQLAAALDGAVARWRSEAGPEAVAPGAGRLAALRRRFHELGAGNPFAAAEYTEARSRLDTMEAQAADLERAITSTRQLIADLNALIATQFRTTFAALEGAFARRFEQLFDGGEAQLALTAPDDLSATGIEITARPPGKKRQPLQMLSGGERALTAVALLLAMLEVRPVPFCVLDEVDAALDEANIARFAQALRGLADKTQFIVITHNRGTIENADALYGVTIGADAVSRVVSMRLPPVDGNGAGSPEAGAETAAEVLA